MSDDDLVLRTASLMDENYHHVKDVVVPKGMDWPPYIRYEGRIFAIYHHTIPATIEGLRAAERNYPYREILVWDATV